MYIQVEPGTFQVTEMNLRELQKPEAQYFGGVSKDLILASVTGRNTMNSRRFIEDIKIQIFDLLTSAQFRGLSPILKASGQEVSSASMSYAILKTSIKRRDWVDSVFASMPPEPIMLDEIFKRGPDFFAKLVCAIEEFYTGSEKIKHTPWLSAYFEKISKGMEFATWKDFSQKTGLLLP